MKGPTIYDVQRHGNLWRVLALKGKARVLLAVFLTEAEAKQERRRLEDREALILSAFRNRKVA